MIMKVIKVLNAFLQMGMPIYLIPVEAFKLVFNREYRQEWVEDNSWMM
jgi:hypothetical protein